MKSVNLKKAVLLSCSVLMIAGLGSACKEKTKVQIAPEEKLPISLTLSQEEFSVMVEETVKIPVSVKNATEAVAFTSTNPSVATVDNNGVVTGLAEGETEIIISVEGVTDSCLVIVTKNIYVPYIAVGNIETNEMNLLKGGNFTLQSVVKANGGGECDLVCVCFGCLCFAVQCGQKVLQMNLRILIQQKRHR